MKKYSLLMPALIAVFTLTACGDDAPDVEAERVRVVENYAELVLRSYDAALAGALDLHAKIERDGVKAAREHQASAAFLCSALVLVNHLAHPGGFAAQVNIVNAGFGTGFDQFVAIQLVGADC